MDIAFVDSTIPSLHVVKPEMAGPRYILYQVELSDVVVAYFSQPPDMTTF